MKFSIGIKVVLATLLALCLASMPLEYYQWVRFFAFVGFMVLAFGDFNGKVPVYMGIIWTASALLFQPFFKIRPPIIVWKFIDVGLALFLLVSIYIYWKQHWHPKYKIERLIK